MNDVTMLILGIGLAGVLTFGGLGALDMPGNMPVPKSRKVVGYTCIGLAAACVVGAFAVIMFGIAN